MMQFGYEYRLLQQLLLFLGIGVPPKNYTPTPLQSRVDILPLINLLLEALEEWKKDAHDLSGCFHDNRIFYLDATFEIISGCGFNTSYSNFKAVVAWRNELEWCAWKHELNQEDAVSFSYLDLKLSDLSTLSCYCIAFRIAALNTFLVVCIPIRKYLRTHQLTSLSVQEVQVYKVISYLEFHLDAPLPAIGELAKMVHTNRETLKKNFKMTCGQTIKQYHTCLRMTHAQILLDTTMLTHQEIAYAVGYNSYNTFYVAYKNHFGKSPKPT